MTLTFAGKDLTGLIAWYVISIPCTYYCFRKLGGWLGEKTVEFVERITRQ